MKRRENLVSHEEVSPIIVRVILSPPIKTNEQMKIRDANIRKENAYIKLRGQFSFLPNKRTKFLLYISLIHYI